jgi:uncharacterized protein YacL
MSLEFWSRIIGMVVFMLVGGRLGTDVANNLKVSTETYSFIFGLLGLGFGVIVTPYFTIRPFRSLYRALQETPIESVFTACLGGILGLLLALLLAYPLSLSIEPLNRILPLVVSLVGAYLGLSVFAMRSPEIWSFLTDGFGKRRVSGSSRQILLDTSVLIDGRIVEIARTGFLDGMISIPSFVLTELHQVADSSDAMRRLRGRRGLNKLNELQRNNILPVKVIDEDIENIVEVDAKLVALCLKLDAPLLTNDYNLNRVAEAQGVFVLNINSLANAVRSMYIPGETFTIHIIQEGKELSQGVGYLEDGTMVVVESGKNYLDRTIRVEATKLITKDTGRMIFARPYVEGMPSAAAQIESIISTPPPTNAIRR